MEEGNSLRNAVHETIGAALDMNYLRLSLLIHEFGLEELSKMQNTWGSTAYTWAIIHSDKRATDALLHMGINPNYPDVASAYPLHLLMRSENTGVTESPNMIKRFVEAGAYIDCIDSRGETPLMMAAKMGKAELVTVLIGLGANVNHKNTKGHSILATAIVAGHQDVVEILRKANAIPPAWLHSEIFSIKIEEPLTLTKRILSLVFGAFSDIMKDYRSDIMYIVKQVKHKFQRNTKTK